MNGQIGTGPTARQRAGDKKIGTLAAFLEGRAAADPHGTALFWEDAAISRAALLEESRRVARGLAELGVARGDRVALWMPNAPAWLALHFACARLGAIVVAINTRFRSSEVSDIVGRSGARILALWPRFRRIDFPAILADIERAALDRLETIVTYGEAVPVAAFGPFAAKRVVGYDELRQRPPLDEDRARPDSGCNIFTTSGTTKAPKFVLHDQAGIATHAAQVAASFGYDAPDSVLLQALPFCGVFGFCQAMAALAGGSPIALPPVFDTEEAAALINRHRVTSFNGSDEMVARLLAARDGEIPYPSLCWVGYAAFNPALAELPIEAERRGIRMVGLYGSSEVQALYARQRPEADAAERTRPGGFPVAPEARVRVRDPETGALLPAGASGELEFAGPSRMVGYYGNEEATRATITEDGFVRSGDLGRIAPEDGSFVFEGRMGDVLRLGGYLVAPSEIEDYVQRHPAVDGCQVVGAASPDGRSVAVAFVTLRPEATAASFALQEELSGFCAKGLARFKVPALFVPLESFPTTASANGTKIQRAKLREMAAARLAEQEGGDG